MVMGTVVLKANVNQIEDRYVARIDDLDLEADGESLEEAQDELIQVTSCLLYTSPSPRDS